MQSLAPLAAGDDFATIILGVCFVFLSADLSTLAEMNDKGELEPTEYVIPTATADNSVEFAQQKWLTHTINFGFISVCAII